MERLKLPKNIRSLDIDEVGGNTELIEKVAKEHVANIVEGYKISLPTEPDLPFNFFAEINIDNDRLWDLFKVLLIDFPDEVALIFGHIDEDLVYGKYMDKFSLLNQISSFEIEFTQDGFFEWGTIYHTDEYLYEVFVKKGKYLQYWGMDMELFQARMKQYGLNHIEELNYIDEFPVVTEVLWEYIPDVVRTEDLVDRLKELFVE